MHRILLVDDEPSVLSALSRDLHGLDYEIETFTDIDRALKRTQSALFDLVISDFRMPQMSGIDFLNKVKAYQIGAVRMLLSGHTDINVMLAAINEVEAFRYITKPWDAESLRASVSAALEYGKHMTVGRRSSK